MPDCVWSRLRERWQGFRLGFGGLDRMVDCVEASPSALKWKNSMRKPDCAWLVGHWVGDLSGPKVQEFDVDA